MPRGVKKSTADKLRQELDLAKGGKAFPVFKGKREGSTGSDP